MIRPLRQLAHEGPRHRVAPPSLQERRLRRLLRIAGRVHRTGLQAWDYEIGRTVALHGTQPEPNRRGLRGGS